MLTVLSRSDTLPSAARLLVGASLRLLARADDAAVRAGEHRQRLLERAVLPLPRRPYDEL